MSNYKVKSHIIAYFDILGYQNYIMENQNAFFIDIQYCIEKFIIYQANIMKNNWLNDMQLKIFSDNVVIALPVDDNPLVNADRINMLENLVCFIEFNLIKHYKWFIRGCIHIGDLFINDNFVFGKGLVEAYNYENNVALYPRIILTPELIDFVSEDVDFHNMSIDTAQLIYLRLFDYSPQKTMSVLQNILFQNNGKCNKLSDFPDNIHQKIEKLMTPYIKNKIKKLVNNQILKDSCSIYYLDFLRYEKNNLEDINKIFEIAEFNRDNAKNLSIKLKYEWFLNYVTPYLSSQVNFDNEINY